MKNKKLKIALITGILLFLGLTFPTNAAVLTDKVENAGFSVTDHLLFSSERENGDLLSPLKAYLMHEARLGAEYGKYSLEIHFTNQLTQESSDPRYHPFELEKKTARAHWDDWKLIVGDSHQEFGKGIALSLYSDPNFGIDNTLEGISLQFNPQRFEITSLAGRINTLDSPVALYSDDNPLRDRDIWILGTEVEGKISGSLHLGSHYLIALNKPFSEPTFDKNWQTFGAFFSKNGLLDGWDIYFESDLLVTRELATQDQNIPNGYGNYGSITWSPVPWQFKIEGRDYRDYRFDFRRPPTLEEDIVETINTQDVSALRFQTERSFEGAFSSVRGSYLIGEDRTKASVFHHGILGAKINGPWHSKVELSSGYRVLPEKASLAHGAIKTKFPTFKKQSVEFGVTKKIDTTHLDFISLEEDSNTFNLTYNFSSDFNLSFALEYLPTNDDETGKYFANVGTTLKAGPLTGKAFLGSTSGGTICSGGVCKRIPPYSGVMIESIYSF